VQNRQQAAEAQLAQLEAEKADTDTKIEAGDIDPALHQKQVYTLLLYTLHTLSSIRYIYENILHIQC
jgi:DNA-binding GntR family transcriptional regulator